MLEVLAPTGKPRKRFNENFYNMFDNPEEVRKIADPVDLIPSMRNTFMSQRFGVEIELEGLTVRDAAKLMREFYHGNGHNHRGGIWTINDFNGRPWEVKEDGSVPDGFEISSPPLQFRDIHLAKQILIQLDKHKARATEKTGIHIHIDVNGWSAQELISILFLYANFSKELAHALDLREPRRSTYCQPITDIAEALRNRALTEEELRKAWYIVFEDGRWRQISDNEQGKIRGTRYREINFHRHFEMKDSGQTDKDTIEFRAFNSTRAWRTFQSYILFILTGVSFAKHLPRPPKLENDLNDVNKVLFFKRLETMMLRFMLIEDDLVRQTKSCFDNNFKQAAKRAGKPAEPAVPG
jgi:hypothetical protein